MKFEAVQILFLVIFGLLSSKKFATKATWRNDVSSVFTLLFILLTKLAKDSAIFYQIIHVRCQIMTLRPMMSPKTGQSYVIWTSFQKGSETLKPYFSSKNDSTNATWRFMSIYKVWWHDSRGTRLMKNLNAKNAFC